MSSPAEEFNKKAGNYWQAHHAKEEQFFGVHPMGECGLFEVYYRHYFESKHLLKQIRLSPDSTMLDLGCGSGRWALALAPSVKNYIGVDISAEALANAKVAVKKHGINNVTFTLSPIASYVPQEKLSLIYFASVTQYLEDDDLRRALATLEPGITEDTRLVDRSTINYRNREILNQGEYYSIYRTPEEIRSIFAEFGWKCHYEKRTYRFMRGAPLIAEWHVQRLLLKCVPFAGPFLFQLARAFSWGCDVVNPKAFEGGDRSHDFFIFHR